MIREPGHLFSRISTFAVKLSVVLSAFKLEKLLNQRHFIPACSCFSRTAKKFATRVTFHRCRIFISAPVFDLHRVSLCSRYLHPFSFFFLFVSYACTINVNEKSASSRHQRRLHKGVSRSDVSARTPLRFDLGSIRDFRSRNVLRGAFCPCSCYLRCTDRGLCNKAETRTIRDTPWRSTVRVFEETFFSSYCFPKLKKIKQDSYHFFFLTLGFLI